MSWLITFGIIIAGFILLWLCYNFIEGFSELIFGIVSWKSVLAIIISAIIIIASFIFLIYNLHEYIVSCIL